MAAKKKAGLRFDQAVENFIAAQHQLAVIRLLEQVIDPFLVNDDNGEPDKVWTDRLCMRPQVSPDAFLEVLGWLRQREEEVKSKLETLASVTIDVE